MFQYALGRQLAIRNKTSLALDLTFLNHRLPGRQYVFREFDLDVFTFSYETTPLSKMPRGLRTITYAFEKLAEMTVPKLLPTHRVFEERSFSFDANIANAPDNSLLIGYWQSYKYFEDIADIIRKEFSSYSHPLTDASARLMKEIEGTNAVYINIRRTDYAALQVNKDFFGELGMDYYDKAIATIKGKVPAPHFFVFSDDMKWAKENFRTDAGPVTFVGDEYVGYKYSDRLRLMAACEHFIIANSTFAWWGAWLGSRPGKIVIAPRNWVSDPSLSTDDLIPPTWIRI